MAASVLHRDGNSHELHNGDCFIRSEFHSLYEQMPEGYRAELLGGIVFEPSPLSWSHSEWHVQLGYLLQTYAINTPRVAVGDNATVMLSEEDEVQPDLILRIAQDCGGQSRVSASDFVEGAPELVAEIAHSSRAIDLHLKKERYALSGVIEYIVVCLHPKQLFWFDLRGRKQFHARDSVIRSAVFPGLWLHQEGLLHLAHDLTVATLSKGLKSKAHKLFSEQLIGEE